MANPFEKQKYKNKNKNRLWFHVSITSRDDPEMWARAANAGAKAGARVSASVCLFCFLFLVGRRKLHLIYRFVF